VGPGDYLERKRLTASGINTFSLCDRAGEITAKVRYRQKEEPCSYTVRSGMLEVEFDSAVRGVTPGQSVVLYQGDLVLGGGVIERAFR
jgi:tRNA-specific 2-thiouridylase